MAHFSIVEDPRPRRSNYNHPSHPHSLRKTAMRDKYSTNLWRCDSCKVEFDSTKTLPSANREVEADPTFAFHCEECSYDICSLCFKGYQHPFHHHRLKRANVVLVYPETGGQWRCDACLRVFTELTAPMSHHCQLCDIDICDKCFTGSWKHTLHAQVSYHSLKPVDPRLIYRNYMNWFCDVCGREFTFKDSETFFNCSVCQYDICSDCFHGEKHHLHKHPLSLVSKTTHGNDVCSNCSKYILESQYRKCRDPICSFSLCGLCYLSPPKYHPYHSQHPLALCDADAVYPHSAGLWHCDNCTKNNPSGQQKALPTSQIMHHCDICDYDLCESCYKSGLEQSYQHTGSVLSNLVLSNSVLSNSSVNSRILSSGYHTDTNQDSHEMNTSYHSSTTKKLSFSNTSGTNAICMEQPASYYQTSSAQDPSHGDQYKTSSPVMEESLSFALKHAGSAPPSFNSYHPGGGYLSGQQLGGLVRHSSSLYGASVFSGGSCAVCRSYRATKYFCHGKSVMTCTADPVVCERCAGDIITRQKSCPACQRIPDGVSDISF